MESGPAAWGLFREGLLAPSPLGSMKSDTLQNGARLRRPQGWGPGSYSKTDPTGLGEKQDRNTGPEISSWPWRRQASVNLL